MKYSATPGSIPNFVVGETESEYGPPVAVIKQIMLGRQLHGIQGTGQTIEAGKSHLQ
ncbi:hypothetical protein [Desulfocicer vacuolatum]|nr:hypothetical protein [Desulfocicer vacuolatum]